MLQRWHGAVGCSTTLTSQTRRKPSGPTFVLLGTYAVSSNRLLGAVISTLLSSLCVRHDFCASLRISTHLHLFPSSLPLFFLFSSSSLPLLFLFLLSSRLVSSRLVSSLLFSSLLFSSLPLLFSSLLYFTSAAYFSQVQYGLLLFERGRQSDAVVVSSQGGTASTAPCSP